MEKETYLPPTLLTYHQYIENLFYNQPKQFPFRTITFQVTEDCCMKCTYCFQHHKTNNKMSFETAKIFIDKLLNNEYEIINTDNTFAIVYEFFGGEPLMEIDLISQIIEYIFTKMIELDHPWLYYTRYSICSNGLLYNTPKVQAFLKKYLSLGGIVISIDGNKEIHDKCRIDLQGNGTYDRIINNVKLHKNNFGIVPTTKLTFSPDNINYVFDAVINLITEGYIDISSSCVFEKGWDYSHAKIYYNELKKVADYLIYNNLYNKINFSFFQEHSYQPIDIQNNENFCGGVNMYMIAIDWKGDFYPCVRYMESSLNGKQKPLNVGNVYTNFYQTQEEKDNYNLISNITRRSQSTDKCFYCPIAFGCSWCSAYNYEELGTPNKRTSYTCIMHQAASLANVYYWNTLYAYLGIDKQFKMHIPKEWALNIINEQEYEYLLKLNERK